MMNVAGVFDEDDDRLLIIDDDQVTERVRIRLCDLRRLIMLIEEAAAELA
jgi:hypothetical protein